jgi:hypothetical protein
VATVLTTGAKVLCGHPPGAINVESSAKLTVGEKPVLTEQSVLAGTPDDTPDGLCGLSSGSSPPCTKVASVVPASLATKLTAGTKPVVLKLSGLTDKGGTVTGSDTQVKLTAT